MATTRTQTRLALGVLAALCVAAVAAWAAVHLACERVDRIARERSLGEAARVLAALEQADVAKLDAAVTRLLSDPAVVAAFERRDRAGLAAAVRPAYADLAANHGIGQLTFLLPDGTALLRAHRQRDFGDVVRRPVVAEAARTSEVAVGKDLGRSGFALRLVRPVRRGALALGFVEIGERTSAFLGRLKELTGDDYALVVAKPFLDREEWAAAREASGMRDGWEDLPGAVVVDATYRDPRLLRGWGGSFATLPRSGVLLEDADAPEGIATGLLPIWNASAERIGGIVVRHDVSAARGAMGEAKRTLALAFVAIVFVAGLAVLSLARAGPASGAGASP